MEDTTEPSPLSVCQVNERRTAKVNFNWKENRILQQVLLISMLCIGLLFLVYMVTFRRSPLGADAQRQANSTKTALALTAGPLLSPFPTSTAPTATPSD